MGHRREITKRRPPRALRDILTRWRDRELGPTERARRDEPDVGTVAGDELDIASSIAEREMCASLDARHQIRLKAFDAAFDRLQQGLYGICEQCGEEISLERLGVLPFATNCVDCQTERETTVRRTLGDHRWTSSVKIDELFETEGAIEAAGPTPDLPVGSALDPDQEESRTARRATRRRGSAQNPALAPARLEDRSESGTGHSAGIRRGGLAYKASSNRRVNKNPGGAVCGRNDLARIMMGVRKGPRTADRAPTANEV